MSRVQWDSSADEQRYEYGLDRGLVILQDGTAHPWNGLTKVDIKRTTGLLVPIHYEGRRFDVLDSPPELSANVSAYTYPEAIERVTGMDMDPRGVMFDEGELGYFSLSYRTLEENNNYKLVVLMGCKGVPVDTSHTTVTGAIEPFVFSWELQATPQLVSGRLTSRITLDTRKIPSTAVRLAEDILYGTDDKDPDLDGFLKFIENDFDGYMTHYVIDNGDGTWTLETSDNYVTEQGGVFVVDTVDAEYINDHTYVVESSRAPVY